MDVWTDVRTYVRTVDDVLAIKPRFLASMAYHIFLTMVLRTRAPSAQQMILSLADNADKEFVEDVMDHFHKWRPTFHSFVFMLIRPTALVLKQILF